MLQLILKVRTQLLWDGSPALAKKYTSKYIGIHAVRLCHKGRSWLYDASRMGMHDAFLSAPYPTLPYPEAVEVNSNLVWHRYIVLASF